jgi:type I restriction enzyme S subunit
MQLLKHFKELTVQPKNAQELKGLILQLAIQGKLTANWREENPDVKPASELLKRIQRQKEQLIKDKKLKKEKPLSKIKKEDLNINIPNNWETVRLGEIGDWGAGSTPLRSNSSFYGGKINWFKSGELNNSIMDYESKEKITELALNKTSVRLNSPGDVLIAMYGATIGKTGILQVIGTTNQAVCACTPFSCITSLFLHLLLKGLKDTFINQGEGGAQPNISRVKIRTQVFGLPPLEEQKEIVKVVEILFKEIEQLEQLTSERIALKEDFVTSALNQLTTNKAKTAWAFLQDRFKNFFNETGNIKKLRETVLQLAVQGKLTADWRTCHPELAEGSHHASELLKRIQVKKAKLIKEKKIKKEKVLPAITEEEIPYDLPSGWVWCRMNDLIKFMAYGTSQKTNDNRNTVPVLRMGNLSSEGTLHFNNLKYIPAEHRDLPKLYLKFGDLVFNRTNSYELVGKSAVYKGKENEYTLASYLIKVSLFIDEVNFDYINNYIISRTCRKTQIEPQITAQTNQANFSGSKLQNVLVPLPSKEEQKAIVEKVNALMELCDGLEQEVKHSQEQSELLMKSCLREVSK